jgi:uncharacterized protein YbgA (DUF1722 family)/uncharacterized protein YbbK (DUF523 family)
MQLGAAKPRWAAPSDSIRIGVSSCLLGHEVRYNGGHKRDAFLVETFGPYVEWVPVCPEVELGMGTPREPVRLERRDDEVALVGTTSRTDHTAAMLGFARRRVAALAEADLCGYVLKKDSPSCGMERVRVYGARGVPSRSGRGLFADALLQRYPDLPVEEEGRLCEPRLRENFVERVFAYRRLRVLFGARWSAGELIAFHTAHKLQLLAHSTTAYQKLGRLVAGAHGLSRAELRDGYSAQFMAALRRLATVRSHTNVLQHMAGYFKKQLHANARHELSALIDDYRCGLVPLVVPVTLVRHYVRYFDVAYLKGQMYLDPHPKELMLRNHA